MQTSSRRQDLSKQENTLTVTQLLCADVVDDICDNVVIVLPENDSKLLQVDMTYPNERTH